jgi:DNA-binding MarR family transcriptional regulator
MEIKDLVRREDCEGDKRGTFAVITGHGLATIERVAPSHVDSVRRHFMDHIPEERLGVLTDTYQPVLERLRRIRDRD